MLRKIAVLLGVLALLTGCGPAEVEKVGEESLPESITPEEAAVLYARFLQDDIPASRKVSKEWEAEDFHSKYFPPGFEFERALDMYLARDLTGDGIPELYIDGPGNTSIWSIAGGHVVCIGGLGTYDKIIANGAVFYCRSGGVPIRYDYSYQWFSPESEQLPEIGFQSCVLEDSGQIDKVFYVEGEQVTEEEWNEITAPYFDLWNANPTEDQRSVPFREWAASLGVTLPEPEMNADKARRMFYHYICWDWEHQNSEKSADILRVWDFDGDGIPELYENEEPYLVYGVTGLHVECLGTAEELGGVSEEAPCFWGAMPASTPAPEATANPAGASGEPVLLSLVDFSSYEAELDEEDWNALSRFFPVLMGAEPFWGDHLSSLEESVSPLQEIFLPDFFHMILGDDLDGQPFPYRLESFALCDLDGDGERELALWSSCAGGWYVVLRREADGFYGAYMPVRWFAGLQQNGVFCGMGAMANMHYERLGFSGGHFYSVTLGATSYRAGEGDTVHYFIGEAEVSQAEFDLWLDQLLAGDAVWHNARTSDFIDDPAALSDWQRAYIEALRQELERLDAEITMRACGLYDIDKDGVPELFFSYGPGGYDTWHIYTCQNGRAVLAGDMFLSHEEWNTYPSGNGVLKYWCLKGAREVTLYCLIDGELVENTVFPDTVPQPGDLLKELFPDAEPLHLLGIDEETAKSLSALIRNAPAN